jgi:hypothetical protein
VGTAAERLFTDDDAPPQSGVRRCAPRPPAPSHEEVLTEVTLEVYDEVRALTEALAPLQGGWRVPSLRALDRLAWLMVDVLCA